VTTAVFTDVRRAYAEERKSHTNGQAKAARRPVLVVLAAVAVGAAVFAARHLPGWQQVRTNLLCGVAGVGFTVAAWGVDWKLGLVVLAACALVAEALPNRSGT
jgi:hypothetical protein